MMTAPDQLPDNNRLALRHVARACNKASLASLLAGSGGAPYASLVTVAFDHDLAPILLLSGLSDHTKNIMADPRVSLLLDGTQNHANPQTGPRVTLTGRAERSTDPRLTARFLARHPAAALYAGFADFAIWRIQPERAHFVGGFGRAVWFDAPFGLDPNGLAECEQDLLSAINTTHADALTRLGAGWRVTALDVDGMDLANQDDFRRMTFPAPVADAPQTLAAAGEVLRPLGL
ncbi:MAG: pyridoxamine 5'-phosphate oxidase family protein [Rhodospirillaceae bacterium]|nr:pyridoxamine 5'-phosphate oxidase family protein [Rhodospirillales bacterium]